MSVGLEATSQVSPGMRREMRLLEGLLKPLHISSNGSENITKQDGKEIQEALSLPQDMMTYTLLIPDKHFF